MPLLATDLGKERQKRTLAQRYQRYAVPFLIVCFSVYYFVDVLLRASEKYYWFDEIVTLNVCRFSSIPAMWNALRHGVDFIPLPFYVVTNMSRAVFGDNLIGPRVPEMIAFWVMCLCLFRFVNRRAGLVAGLIAMVLPTLTGAFYYAYEARPHGLTCGFGGLALICWQMAIEKPDRRRWLVFLSLSLLGAGMMHCYAIFTAVPFAVVELVNSLRFRRIYWPMWIALGTPVLLACLSYVPLLVVYRALTKNTLFAQSYMTNLGHLVAFFGFLLMPCILFVVWSFSTLAADRVLGTGFQKWGLTERMATLVPEVVLGAAFVALPLFGFVVSKFFVHGLFEHRYFATAVIGVCILLGLAVGARGSLNWMPITLAILLAFPVAWNFGALVWHRHQGIPEKLYEPSSGFSMNSSLTGPLGRYSELLPKDARPIGIMRFYDFLYLIHYAPELRQRVYYVKRTNDDFFDVGFENFHPWAGYQYNHDVSTDEFVHLSPHSYVLGVIDGEGIRDLSRLVEKGATVKSMHSTDDHFVAEMETR